MMNLYLLVNRFNNGYDTYDSCVVASKNAWLASRITPYPSTSYDEERIDSVWVSSQDVLVKLIGTAEEGIEEGTVMCASFNAG